MSLILLRRRRDGPGQPPVGGTLDYGHPIALGLVACWDGIDDAGNLLYDSTGNSHLQGSTAPSLVATQAPIYVARNISATAYFTQAAKPDPRMAFGHGSVEAWVAPGAWPTFAVILERTDGNAADGIHEHFRLQRNNTASGFIFHDGSHTVSGGSSVTGRWSHVVGTCVNGNAKLYVDGQLISTSSAFNNPLNSPSGAYVNYGLYCGGTATNFVGKLGPVRLWGGRILSPDDVRQLHEDPWCMRRGPR